MLSTFSWLIYSVSCLASSNQKEGSIFFFLKILNLLNPPWLKLCIALMTNYRLSQYEQKTHSLIWQSFTQIQKEIKQPFYYYFSGLLYLLSHISRFNTEQFCQEAGFSIFHLGTERQQADISGIVWRQTKTKLIYSPLACLAFRVDWSKAAEKVGVFSIILHYCNTESQIRWKHFRLHYF